MSHPTPSLLVLAALSLGVGCASAASTSATSAPSGPEGHGSVGVGQGGAQDIAEFRSILASGAVPDPRTLDAVGFFAEHAFDLPPADCGEAVCAHAALAVAPRFDGSPWAAAFVALNTSVDPATLARPPVHTVLVIEHTDRTALVAPELFDAMHHFVTALRPEDRVSIVSVQAHAELLANQLAPNDPGIVDATTTLMTPGTDRTAATYAGLALASRALEADGWIGHRHVILLTSGLADAGVADQERIVGLASAMLQNGATISVVGAGAPFSDGLPIALGELGGGAYYFVESPADVTSILDAEARTALFPIGRDLHVEVVAAAGYRVDLVVGAARTEATDERATLDAPLLLVGQREGATDVDHGRRGGGGGLFVELIADPASGIAAGSPAFSVEVSYTDAATSERVTVRQTVLNALRPGEVPADMQPRFSDGVAPKVFMALNAYLALRASTEFFVDGDCDRAVGTVDMVRPAFFAWQMTPFADPDVAADIALLDTLHDVELDLCRAQGPVAPVQPRSFHGGCFGI